MYNWKKKEETYQPQGGNMYIFVSGYCLNRYGPIDFFVIFEVFSNEGYDMKNLTRMFKILKILQKLFRI
jgi:hypothetical protein